MTDALRPAQTPSLLRSTLVGLGWSMVQSWGGKALQFLLFLVLARLLTPEEFGLAVAVSTLLLLLAALAEFGFGEALIQRRELGREDINLPFLISMTISISIALGMALLSQQIEVWIATPGLAPLLVVASFILPLTTASAFQEALYKRDMNFRTLAFRQIVALILSGIVGLACAFAGMGAVSMVLQQLVFVAIGAAWLWWQNKWLPSFSANPASLAGLTRYSINVVVNRLLDFFTVRTVEFLILGAYGAVGLGVYAVGARVYMTLIQLFVTAVSDVSLSALSKISHEADRFRTAYLRSMTISALLTVPVFAGVAALSAEYTVLLFGEKWAEAAGVMQPLMLVGAIQGVQYINGAYFSALGRPHIALFLNLLKFIAVVGSLLAFDMTSITAAATVFAIAQLITTPFSFGLISKHLKIGPRDIFLSLAPFYMSAVMGWLAVTYLRPYVEGFAGDLLLRAFILSVLFAVVYLGLVALTARRKVMETVNFLLQSRRGKA